MTSLQILSWLSDSNHTLADAPEAPETPETVPQETQAETETETQGAEGA